MRRARAARMRRLMAAATVALVATVPAGSSLTTAPPATVGSVGHGAGDGDAALGIATSHTGDRANVGFASSGAGATAELDGEVPIAPPPAAFDAPAAPAVAPPTSLSAATFEPARGGVWAVIVGIDDYPGQSHDLRASVNDAEAADAALAAYGVPRDRVVVLRDGQATAGVIRTALRWLVDRAGTDATAVFFYAGHVRKLGPGSEAIVGADGGLVTDRDVAWDLKRLRARSTWIALAACYAGGFTEVMAPGRVLTGAADASSLAYESSAYGRSYLGEFMIERAMRNGWAAGSVEQAFSWAQDELRRKHPKRLLVQYDEVDGDIVLGPPPPAEPLPPSTTASAPPPQPQAQPQPQAPQPQPESPPPSDPDDDERCLLGFLGTCGDGD